MTGEPVSKLKTCTGPCGRQIYKAWDSQGRCITCSRNAILGEELPPPAASYARATPSNLSTAQTTTISHATPEVTPRNRSGITKTELPIMPATKKKTKSF